MIGWKSRGIRSGGSPTLARGDRTDILQPDAIMPEQFRAIFEPHERLTPAAKLFQAIIGMALRDLTKLPPTHPVYQDAYVWVARRDDQWSMRPCWDHRNVDQTPGRTVSFGFAVECGYVNLDPDILGPALLKRVDRAANGGPRMWSPTFHRQGRHVERVSP